MRNVTLLRRAFRYTLAGFLTIGLASFINLYFQNTKVHAVPGVPEDPVVVFTEDFENEPGLLLAELITSYTGAAPLNMTYTAAPAWASVPACNGIVMSVTSVLPLGCLFSVPMGLQSQAIGTFNGQGLVNDNYALSAYTANNPGVDAIELETAQPIPLPSPNRFITFSVDSAAQNCTSNHALYKFYLMDGSTEIPVFSNPIDPCTAPGGILLGLIRVGRYTSDAPVLFSGSSLGLRLRNGQGSGQGNDSAIDNIRMLDVTPQLDKSFSPNQVAINNPSTLTFTITNTSDLLPKNGWSFTDNLPAGLVVASPNNATTTCNNGVVAVSGTSITVSGNLATGEISCTASIDVTSSQLGTYDNCAANFSNVIGMNLPAACVGLEVAPPIFACPAHGILFQYPNVSGPTQFRTIDMVTGASQTPFTLAGRAINAIGYNTLDNYIYGWDHASDSIIRVGSDGSWQLLGLPTGWTGSASAGYPVGEVDDNGHYWLSTGSNWYQIDLATMTQLSSGIMGAISGNDWTYIPGTDSLYRVGGSGASSFLVAFNRTTKTVTNLGTITGSGNFNADQVGATYTDSDGFLYTSRNDNGLIHRVNVSTQTATLFTNGPTGGNNDGARCANAPIPLDFGDAPDSYATLLSSSGPRHSVANYDSQSNTAPIMLGSLVDIENEGVPTVASDGDDSDTIDDEEGVVFNPSLGYPSPTLLSGLDNTNTPYNNELEVSVTADGFVSVWVDLTGDGDFNDPGENAASAVGVTTGTNTINFDMGTNTPNITTQVRVRYSTDSASIMNSTGPAPDGEVEDYQVLVERAIRPVVCTDSGAKYYAFTFSTPVRTGTTGNVGDTARYNNVSVVNGVPIDLLIDVVAGDLQQSGPGSAPPNGFHNVGDDANWQINQDATLRYRFYEAGTNNLVPVNGAFIASDMDDPEAAIFTKADLTDWTITQGSLVEITETATQVRFDGTVGGNFQPEQQFQIIIEGIHTLEARWIGGAGSGYGFDGDGDLSSSTPACDDFGDAPDSYGTLANNNGARHVKRDGLTLGTEFDIDPDGNPSPLANADDNGNLDDEDGVTAPILYQQGVATAVDATVTNDTDQPATLAGWLDLNNDGQFTTDERATIIVPPNSGQTTQTLTFPFGPGLSDTFARFRLFSGIVADPQPTGPADAGEVEDYQVEAVPTAPIFLGCSELVTFDNDNENWRAATTINGTTTALGPQPVEWQPNAGNPGGAVIEDDLDGNWTELWTPELSANGYTTDYSYAIGETLQFDYKNNTGIAYDIYVAIRGVNGDFVYYIFRSQIVDSTQWTRVYVPMDPSEWVTGFNNNTGPVGAAPSLAEFEAILENVDRFAFSIEGRAGADRTAFDNFGEPCDDMGDAPESYGTLLVDNGPVHRATGYNQNAGTAPLMLGSLIDIEDEGQPAAFANGDDTNSLDDEDGVVSSIIYQQGVATEVDVVVTNEADQPATLAGWLDLNNDGQFTNDERVFVTVPANSGQTTQTLTFPLGPAAADSFARFRVFSGEVADPQPLGTATGGEVEDYTVTRIEPQSDLTVAKSHNGSPVAGTTFNYDFHVTNNGPSDSGSFQLVDNLDPSITYISSTPDICSANGQEVTCYGGFLASGETTVVSLTVMVIATHNGDPIPNRVTVSGPNIDPTPGNNTSQDNVDPSAEADISIVKELVTDMVAGEQATYEINVTNNGPSAASGVTITDQLPEGLTPFLVAAGNGWSCNFVENGISCLLEIPLLPNETSGITLVVEVAPDVSGEVENIATVTVTTFDPFMENNQANTQNQVIQEADMGVSKILVGNLIAGEQATYQLQVTNHGPSVAPNPVVTDTLPDGLTYVSYNALGWDCSLTGQDISCTAPSMAPNTSSTIEINTMVTGSPGQEQTNQAGVNSDAFDFNTDNDNASVTQAIQPKPDTFSPTTGSLAETGTGLVVQVLFGAFILMLVSATTLKQRNLFEKNRV